MVKASTVRCGFYDLDKEIKEKWGFLYFVARHICNPTKIKIVFIKDGSLEGDSTLCDFIRKQKLFVNKKDDIENGKK